MTSKQKFILTSLFTLCTWIGIEAAVLNYTVPEAQRSIQDFGQPLLSFRIAQTANAQGNLLSSDGLQIIGTYSFHGFPNNPALAGVEFVKINRDENYSSYLFLSKGNRTSLTYLGWTDTYWAFDTALDTSNYIWIAVATFLTAPSAQITPEIIEYASAPLSVSASQQGYLPPDMNYFFGQSTGHPREMYFQIFFNRLLDILFLRPTLVLSENQYFVAFENTSLYPVVSANNRYAIVKRITDNWSKFSVANQLILAQGFVHGDGRVQNAMATPVTNLIRAVGYDQAGVLYPNVRNIAINPEVTSAKRLAILTAIKDVSSAEPYYFANTAAAQLIKEILDDADGVALNKADYIHLADQLAQGSINYYESNMHLLQFRPSDVTLNPAFLIKNFPYLISSSSPLVPFYNSYYDSERAAVLASNLKDKSWRELVAILRDEVLLNNETIIRHVLDKTSALIVQNFAAQKLQDFYIANQFTDFDQVVLYMVRLMKKKNIYDDNKWLLPILRLYNPRQPGESDASIAARRGQVVGMWNLQKILMFDIYGGMLNGALRYGNPENNINYALSFQEYGRSAPMLLDIGFLRNYGNVTGADGVVYMNWLPNQNAQHFALNVFHEGSHATEAAFKAKSSWKVMQDYLFEKSYASPNAAIVSYYSLFNTAENHAELHAWWAYDGAGLLRYAIERAKVNDSRLLNQFLVLSLTAYDGINGMTNLKDRIRLVKIGTDGRSTGAPLPGSWLKETDGTIGTLKAGWYKFTFETKTVQVRFSRSKLTRMITDGVEYTYQ